LKLDLVAGAITCFNHLEKYESQWEGLGRSIPYIMENTSHVPNHKPVVNIG
jgi:hypothetical protein